MLIRTTRSGSQLLLIEGYTFSAAEWMALEEVLRRATARTNFSPLAEDAAGRQGRRYYAEGLQEIEMLGELLQGQFDPTGRFQPAPGSGSPYACREVTRSGVGRGCKDFAASDENSAIVRCGIIAGQQNWLGGDAKPGTCRSNK